MNWVGVQYELYGVPNLAYFATLFQYQNWRDVLEEEFGTQFQIKAVIDLERNVTKS